jgi:FK506-binding protein 1
MGIAKDNEIRRTTTLAGQSQLQIPCQPTDTSPIAGWDEGVLNAEGGMSLGEKTTLTITG